jgi:DNA-directed RNA polymerase alpha subunit
MDEFLSGLSAPARNALQHAGITSLETLAQHTEKEILKLHGMGPASMPTLRQALQAEKLAFRDK